MMIYESACDKTYRNLDMLFKEKKNSYTIDTDARNYH